MRLPALAYLRGPLIAHVLFLLQIFLALMQFRDNGAVLRSQLQELVVFVIERRLVSLHFDPVRLESLLLLEHLLLMHVLQLVLLPVSHRHCFLEFAHLAQHLIVLPAQQLQIAQGFLQQWVRAMRLSRCLQSICFDIVDLGMCCETGESTVAKRRRGVCALPARRGSAFMHILCIYVCGQGKMFSPERFNYCVSLCLSGSLSGFLSLSLYLYLSASVPSLLLSLCLAVSLAFTDNLSSSWARRVGSVPGHVPSSSSNLTLIEPGNSSIMCIWESECEFGKDGGRENVCVFESVCVYG